MAAVRTNPPVRGTQLLVEHMGEVFRRPSLIAIEIAWRWLFGIPFLLVFLESGPADSRGISTGSSGFNSIDTQNPWVAAVQLTNVASYYEPHVLAVLRWLLPVAALALGGGLRPGPQFPCCGAWKLRTAFPPRRDDRSAGRMAGPARAHASGVGSVPCSGRLPRTSPWPASPIWSAISSGPSFSRWDSSQRLR